MEEDVTDEEIKKLEEELKQLPDNYGAPPTTFNQGMELVGNWVTQDIVLGMVVVLFRNKEGTIFRLMQVERKDGKFIVLRKLKAI